MLQCVWHILPPGRHRRQQAIEISFSCSSFCTLPRARARKIIVAFRLRSGRASVRVHMLSRRAAKSNQTNKGVDIPAMESTEVCPSRCRWTGRGNSLSPSPPPTIQRSSGRSTRTRAHSRPWTETSSASSARRYWRWRTISEQQHSRTHTRYTSLARFGNNLQSKESQTWVELEKSFASCTWTAARATRQWWNIHAGRRPPSSRWSSGSMSTIELCIVETVGGGKDVIRLLSTSWNIYLQVWSQSRTWWWRRTRAKCRNSTATWPGGRGRSHSDDSRRFHWTGRWRRLLCRTSVSIDYHHNDAHTTNHKNGDIDDERRGRVLARLEQLLQIEAGEHEDADQLDQGDEEEEPLPRVVAKQFAQLWVGKVKENSCQQLFAKKTSKHNSPRLPLWRGDKIKK